PSGDLQGAEPDRRLADARPLRRHLLPERGHLFRRRDTGAGLGPVHADPEPRRRPLHRPFRAGDGPGGATAATGGPHHLRQGSGGMSAVSVLVVDDSATMRSLISAVLRRDPEINVVGTAADPLEARAKIKELNPDVITLD